MAPPTPLPPPPVPIVAPAPLPVDTVTSGWDILGALGDFFGGIFAGGAFLVGAIAYMRQVNDSRRTQAAMVEVIVPRDDEDGDQDFNAIRVKNHSRRSIHDVSCEGFFVSLGRGGGWETLRPAPVGHLTSGGSRLFHAPDDERAVIEGGRVEFRDSSGHRWRRTDDDELSEIASGILRRHLWKLRASRSKSR